MKLFQKNVTINTRKPFDPAVPLFKKESKENQITTIV